MVDSARVGSVVAGHAGCARSMGSALVACMGLVCADKDRLAVAAAGRGAEACQDAAGVAKVGVVAAWVRA